MAASLPAAAAYMDDPSAPRRFAKHDFKRELPPFLLPLPPGYSHSAYLVVSALNEAACALPGFVLPERHLRCDPWVAGGGATDSVAALLGTAVAPKAAQQTQQQAVAPPRYWLSVTVPTVPRPGGVSFLEGTLASLLRQLPADPAGKQSAAAER